MEALHSVRTTLLLSFRYLPVLLIPYIGFLAGALSNVAMLSLFLGHIAIVPIGTLLLRILPLPGRIPWSDIGSLFPSHPVEVTHNSQPTITTYWMGHIVFFFAYVFLNALALYSLPADPDASEWMVTNRKTKLITILAVLCVVFAGIVYTRYATTGVESILGILVAMCVFIPAAWAWYTLATRCGLKHGDMFGIVNQIIPKSIQDDVPITCVYAPKP